MPMPARPVRKSPDADGSTYSNRQAMPTASFSMRSMTAGRLSKHISRRRILKPSGCDFTLFDLEHSGFGFETVKSALRYFEAADLPAIVRVPSREYHHIARAMDMGAEGLMLPMVGNVDEVRHIVNSMKYHP